MHRRAELREEKPDISRQALARLIRTYLAGEISAFRFDESLQAFHRSGDALVREVARMLWFFYDDYFDHNFPISKPIWDVHQRFLLALESNCCVETKVERNRSVRQPIAALALVLFAWAFSVTGWGEHIMLVTIPFGFVAIALRREPTNAELRYPFGPIVWPFASFADLGKAYDSSNFRKDPYPRAYERSIDGGRNVANQRGLDETFSRYATTVIIFLFSPLWLLLQVLPETHRSTRFRMD